MRSKLMLALVLFTCIQATSQIPNMVYCDDSQLMNVKDSIRSISRKAIIKNGRYFVTDKLNNEIIYNYLECSSLDPFIEEGRAIYYNQAGRIYAEGLYSEGLIDGKWIYYNEGISADTVLYPVGEINKNVKNCPESRYYKDDKKSADIGRLVIDSLLIFMNDNFHLPARTRDSHRNFTALINCTIDSEGKAVCPEISYPKLHQDIMMEIYRILGLFHYKESIKKPFTVTIFFPYDVAGHPENNIYVVTEKDPEFQYNNLKNGFAVYLQDNIKKPASGCIGEVQVCFVVEKDGRTSGMQIINGLDDCAGYTEEIERVFYSCPQWIPGMVHEKPVRTRLVSTVYFD